MKPFRLSLACLFIFVIHSSLLSAASLTIGWDANSEPDLEGYRVQYGTSSGNYTNEIDAGKVTLKTISSLSSGTRYYFVVLAYNTAGEESLPSQEVSAIAGSVPTPTPSPTASPTPTPTPTPPQYILNLSTRVQVRSGDNVLIGGFIVTGDFHKSIVIRALGPSLSALGVKRPLGNPVLGLYDAAGTLVEENNDWTSLPPGLVPSELQPTNPLESVIVRTLLPGNYTAVLRSADSTIGNALVELYDLDPGNSRVRNMSTRGEVGVGENVMIGGFIVGGSAPAKLLVRALGPSLAAAGVNGALPDPVLELHDGRGSLIYQNDNWRSTQEKAIIDTTVAPADDNEAAILVTLPAGAYTAVLRGANDAAGVALVEIYALDP
jgi:hypothetical protein